MTPVSPTERRSEPRTAAERAKAAIEKPDRIPVVDGVGEYSSFLLQGVLGMRKVGGYTAEVLRQTALIAVASVMIIVFIGFLTGATCGITGGALSRAVGAGIAGPIFSAFCTMREVLPFIFGFIVAAKIGGGIVAQLGSMRVAEEVDAMDVMGVPSVTYLISTRMLAALIMLPIAYMVAMAAAQGGAWFASLIRDAQVSQGTWEFAFYTAIDPIDLVYSGIKGMVLSFTVIAIALFFGYRVRGGPVEVGEATARSMAVNLMAVTILNMVMTFIFWGFNPNLPVA
ncbi:MAG: MlaE family ABC transporter permease [Solirubrobacterales bacterium]